MSFETPPGWSGSPSGRVDDVSEGTWQHRQPCRWPQGHQGSHVRCLLPSLSPVGPEISSQPPTVRHAPAPWRRRAAPRRPIPGQTPAGATAAGGGHGRAKAGGHGPVSPWSVTARHPIRPGGGQILQEYIGNRFLGAVVFPQKGRRFAHHLQETAPAHPERILHARLGDTPHCAHHRARRRRSRSRRAQRPHRPQTGSRPAHPRRRLSLGRRLAPSPSRQLQRPRWEPSAPPPALWEVAGPPHFNRRQPAGVRPTLLVETRGAWLGIQCRLALLAQAEKAPTHARHERARHLSLFRSRPVAHTTTVR